MKNALRILAIGVITGMVMVGCSKDQRKSKDLKGEWLLVEVNSNPINTSEFNEKVEFEPGKKGAGTGTITTQHGEDAAETNPFTYEVDGDQLNVEEPDTSFNFTINELTDVKMTLVAFDTLFLSYDKQ